MNYKGVCRTAPATPGLLKKVVYIYISGWFWKVVFALQPVGRAGQGGGRGAKGVQQRLLCGAAGLDPEHNP